MTADVDVGVVTYNTRDLSVDALRRLVDSDQGCRLRVLVRDNASSDGTADAIARLVPEAELDAGTENLGFAAGMNRLIDRSDAPFFLALNADAWPEPGAIGRLLTAATAHPRAAAVAPRIERPDGALEHSTLPFPSVRIAALLATGAHRLLPPARRAALLLEGEWAHDRARDVEWAVGAALLMRRQALAELGGFDERYFMYSEDVEWCWRAHRQGWTIWFEPGALVRHVGNASGRAAYGDARTSAYMRNTYRFYRSTHGPAATAVYRGLNLAGTAGRWLASRLRGDDDHAGYWKVQARSHLVSTRGVDGPPGGRR